MLVKSYAVMPNSSKIVLIPSITSSGRVEIQGPAYVVFSQSKLGSYSVKKRLSIETYFFSTAIQLTNHFSVPSFLIERFRCQKLSLLLSSYKTEVLFYSSGMVFTYVMALTSQSPSFLENQKMVFSGMQRIFHERLEKYVQFTVLGCCMLLVKSANDSLSLFAKVQRTHLEVVKPNLHRKTPLVTVPKGRDLPLATLLRKDANFLVLVNILLIIERIPAHQKLYYFLSMLGREKAQVSMNLPVGSHIDRLAEMISGMRGQTETIEKELQILRGNITQLSYINKESDRQLNAFLVDSIASLRNKWSEDWAQNTQELADHMKKIGKLAEEHEDIEIIREQLGEKVMGLEGAVGLKTYE